MYRKLAVFFLIIILSVLLGCVTTNGKRAKQPTWIATPEESYPRASYISAVGEGKTKLDAENAAYEAIVTYLKQDISIKTQANQQVSANSSDFSRTYKATTEVNKNSSIKELVGLTIKETWNDDEGKNYYALAILDKKLATSYYADHLKRNNTIVKNIFERVDTIKKEHGMSSIEGYLLLKEAQAIAEINEGYLTVLLLVNPAQYRLLLDDTVSIKTIETFAKDEAKSISLHIAVEGDSNAIVTTEISRVFNDIGIYTTNDSAKSNYSFDCTIQFSTLPPQKNAIVYVRYTFTGSLRNKAENKILYSFTFTDKDGQYSEEEARNRSLRTIAQRIKSELPNDIFSSLLE